MNLTLCMIVKNEEATLSRTLDSVKGVVDEIVVLDTGSGDRTREMPENSGRGFMTLNGATTSQRRATSV